MNLSGLAAKSAIWLDFREGSGSTVYDRSGNGNHGTLSGAVWQRGEKGWEVGFDGVDDYIGDDIAIQVSDRATIVCIFKASPPGEAFLFGKESAVKLNCFANQVAFLTSTDWGGSIAFGPVTNFSAQPNFVVGVYDGSSKKVYTNGNWGTPISSSGSITDNNIYMRSIGALISVGGTGTNYLNGSILFAAYFNLALSDAQITALYHHLMGV